MDKALRTAFLHTSGMIYRLGRPLLFTRNAQQAHNDVLRLLRLLDASTGGQWLLQRMNQWAFPSQPVQVGGVGLPHPFILAAGFVKGTGFSTEAQAMQAVSAHENIIPGWRSMPALVGAVEFGSYTRWPRKGNFGQVIWRDKSTHSTQNRVGLKNPGVKAAAAFLAMHHAQLPRVYGINIAVTPGVVDPDLERQDAVESISAFLELGIRPSWFTLNVSCPNTEDDPGNRQTEQSTVGLCRTVTAQLAPLGIPLWVKLSPELAPTQYEVLMRVFQETGIKAVIATNTLPRSAPDHTEHTAGVGGGRLHPHAVEAVRYLAEARAKYAPDVDIVGCGGIQDPLTFQHFTAYRVNAVQYWSALVYRGPLAAALILNDVQDDVCGKRK
ncbi:MAG: quinone-dependent dihydroorotate dehydrogenase [Anaerolineae bacterium]